MDEYLHKCCSPFSCINTVLQTAPGGEGGDVRQFRGSHGVPKGAAWGGAGAAGEQVLASEPEAHAAHCPRLRCHLFSVSDWRVSTKESGTTSTRYTRRRRTNAAWWWRSRSEGTASLKLTCRNGALGQPCSRSWSLLTPSPSARWSGWGGSSRQRGTTRKPSRLKGWMLSSYTTSPASKVRKKQ